MVSSEVLIDIKNWFIQDSSKYQMSDNERLDIIDNFDALIYNKSIPFPYCFKSVYGVVELCPYLNENQRLGVLKHVDDFVDRQCDETLNLDLVFINKQDNDYFDKHDKSYWIKAAKDNGLNYNIIENINAGDERDIVYAAAYGQLLLDPNKGWYTDNSPVYIEDEEGNEIQPVDLTITENFNVLKEVLNHFFVTQNDDLEKIRFRPGWKPVQRIIDKAINNNYGLEDHEIDFLSNVLFNCCNGQNEFLYFNKLFSNLKEYNQLKLIDSFEEQSGKSLKEIIGYVNQNYDNLSDFDKNLAVREVLYYYFLRNYSDFSHYIIDSVPDDIKNSNDFVPSKYFFDLISKFLLDKNGLANLSVDYKELFPGFSACFNYLNNNFKLISKSVNGVEPSFFLETLYDVGLCEYPSFKDNLFPFYEARQFDFEHRYGKSLNDILTCCDNSFLNMSLQDKDEFIRKIFSIVSDDKYESLFESINRLNTIIGYSSVWPLGYNCDIFGHELKDHKFDNLIPNLKSYFSFVFDTLNDIYKTKNQDFKYSAFYKSCIDLGLNFNPLFEGLFKDLQIKQKRCAVIQTDKDKKPFFFEYISENVLEDIDKQIFPDNAKILWTGSFYDVRSAITDDKGFIFEYLSNTILDYCSKYISDIYSIHYSEANKIIKNEIFNNPVFPGLDHLKSCVLLDEFNLKDFVETIKETWLNEYNFDNREMPDSFELKHNADAVCRNFDDFADFNSFTYPSLISEVLQAVDDYSHFYSPDTLHDRKVSLWVDSVLTKTLEKKLDVLDENTILLMAHTVKSNCEFRNEKFVDSIFFKDICSFKLYAKPFLVDNFEEFKRESDINQILFWCDQASAPFKSNIYKETRDFIEKEYDQNPGIDILELFDKVMNQYNFFVDGCYYAVVKNINPDNDTFCSSLKEFPSFSVFNNYKNLVDNTNVEICWEGTSEDVCRELNSVSVCSSDKTISLQQELEDIILSKLKLENKFISGEFDLFETLLFIEDKLNADKTFVSISDLCYKVLDNNKLQNKNVLSDTNFVNKEPNFKGERFEKQLNKQNNKHFKKI